MDCDILLLNGPSSSGKSSIAREIQKRLACSGIDAAVISIDDYMRISTNEPIWEDDVFEIMPDLCRGLTGALRQSRLAIVDHVITSARIYEALLEAAAGYRLKTVRVQCSAALLKQREAARGDRFAGSAEASLRYLYPQSGYDLCVDSGKATPAEIAARLMALL